jgi:hypothetical protein
MPRLSKIGAAALGAFGWTGLSSISASYLQVAGGGGGGGNGGGGGGAGGYLTGTTSLNLTLSYTVVVGGGGGGAVGSGSSNGSNSQFGTLTASVGGGAGGALVGNGVSGGSGGGGGSGYGASNNFGLGASGTSGQGSAGGNGYNLTSSSPPNLGGGGGGGASAVGSVGNNTQGGAGGNGTASSISGTSVTYAGGGGGGGGTATVSGGTGGGGTGGGGSTRATAGTANLGGGGGGGGNPSTDGGNGGSGIVIISYAGAQQFGGGVVTSSGGYTIHTFNTSGTLAPISSLTASYLIVAGGGAGYGGGGGAGGYLTGSGVTIDTNSTYLITVGAGGAGGGSIAPTNGTNSAFSMVTTAAVGGGTDLGGASGGASGGSGGGGGMAGGVGSTAGGAGTSGQGNSGGTGSPGGASPYPAGGGGGAGSAGGSAVGTTAGNGGVGLASSISGTSTYYAGGGGGGVYFTGYNAGTGGSGGGGNGFAGVGGATAGTANTGGGGGGSSSSASPFGASGGSGVVIISYAGATQQMAGGTVTISGGNVIHTFTSSGYLTPLKLVNNSLRFRSSASAYLNRTPTNSGSTTSWTWSGWVKRGYLGANQTSLFFGDSTTTNYGGIYFTADALHLINRPTSGTNAQLTTTQLFRDPAAWYHIVAVWDTSNATSGDRLRLYVNGVRVTAFSTATYPASSTASVLNTAIAHEIGAYVAAGGAYGGGFDGEMTEINFIDGQALTPNAFGTFNSYGVWQPITYGGSYGTNGFYLPMNPGSSTYAAPFNGTSQLISAPANAVFNFTGNFTAECWANTSTITNATQPVLFTIGSDSGGLVVGFYAGTFYCYMLGSGGLMTAATLPLNQWVHVAWVRVSGVNTLYINGVASATASISGTLSSTGGVTVGKTGSSGSTYNYFQGSVSNFRVNNTALYTGNFIPPTSALTAVSGTQLLTLQNATIIDNSTNAFTITNTGSVATVVSYPFNLNKTIDYSPQGNNWTNNNIGTVTGTTLDVMTDVPTLTSATVANTATLNPLDYVNSNTGSLTLTNGNLLVTRSTTAYGGFAATMALPTSTAGGGKFVFEFTSNNLFNGSTNEAYFGIGVQSTGTIYSSSNTGYADDFYTAVSVTGATGAVYRKFAGGANTLHYAPSVAVATNDVFQFLVDMTNGTVNIKKNGSTYGTQITGLSTTIVLFPYISMYGSVSMSANFGQQPFASTPTSGYLALNAYNI